MKAVRSASRDAAQMHYPVPVHGDQITRASRIANMALERGAILFMNGRTDVIRLAAEFGLTYVQPDDCLRRMNAPKNAGKVSVAFPYILVLRARDRNLASAAATVRAAIDYGLAFYEHVAATAVPEPVGVVPWLEHDSG